MIATILLASLLTSQPAPVQVPPFRPRLNVRIRAAGGRPQPAAPEIVCGMPMIRKTPADDPKIIVPARDTGAVIRRIEPQGCGRR